MTHTYSITGLTCSGCVAKAKSAFLKLSDVISAEVQLNEPQATIEMQKHIGLPVLQEALRGAGNYTITENHSEKGMGVSDAAEESRSYLPIILIFLYITGASLLVQFGKGTFNTMEWMSHFMAGFFLVFSFFKIMNLSGFADGYQTYDIIAKRFRIWGYIYPFIELGLGMSYLLMLAPATTNAVAFVVMGLSTIGVAKSMVKNTPFECACLGTVIKLPLSKVTLFEDVLMVLMSGWMLFRLL
ncbi:MAG: cation transporter [Mucilaginibacter polytrichastri]|nr:cation transporter [Mucilaginibacter polytrichastri]